MSFFSLCLTFFFTVSSAFATEHFTAVHFEGSNWRVDHYTVEEGKLQVLNQSKTFLHESSARRFSKIILSKNSHRLVPLKLVSTEKSASPLWVATQVWNEDWERKYAEWIEKKLTLDFFQKYNLAVDCADVPYSLRWIFSRMNGLPAMASLSGTGTVVTHEVSRTAWDHLPTNKDWSKDQKFLAALDWLLDVTYTGSLLTDSYSIAINDHTIRAGVTHMLASHAEIISHISNDIRDVPVTMTSSSVPRAVRIMNQRAFLDQYPVKQALGGFMRFRWPVKTSSGWKMTAKESMPYYSVEQFQKNLCTAQPHFAFCFFEKANLKFSPPTIISKLTKDLEASLLFREKTVTDGNSFCAQNDCTPGTEGWENWSTPSRDERLNQLFQNTENLALVLNQSATFQKWLGGYRLQNRPGSFSLLTLKENLASGLVSFDPRDSLQARWSDSSSAVLESVNSKYRDGLISREESIKASLNCRSNPDRCKTDSDSLKGLSSLDIDYYLRSLVSSWMKFCETHACPSHSYASIFQKIWLQSPLPWDSEPLRRGEVGSLKAGRLLLAQTIEAGVAGTLILDHTKLYRLADQKIILRSDALAYDPSTQRLLSATSGKLSVLDSSLQEIKSMVLDRTLHQIHSFENGSFFIFNAEGGFTLNPATAGAGTLQSFRKIFRSSEDARSILLEGETNILVSATLKSVKTTPLLNHDPIGDFIPFSEDEALVTINSGSTRVGFLGKNGFSELEKEDAPNFHLLRINSSFYMVQNEDPARGFSPSLIFNSRKELWKSSGYYSRSLFRGTDERLVFEANDSHRDLYLFQGNKIVKTGLGFEAIDPVVSVTPDSLYVQKQDDESQVLDFSGRELSSSNEFSFGKCRSTIYIDQCQGSSPTLGFANAIRKNIDTDGYLNFTQYTLGNSPLAYGIKVFTGENLQDGHLRIKTGSGIQLSRGVVLWYP